MPTTAPTRPATTPPRPAEASTDSRTAPRLLLVDDDPGPLEALAELLRSRGVGVETCTDAEEALERFGSECFDAVIADERMPRLTGREMLSRVRAASPRTPTILVTGYLDAAVIDDAHGRCGVYRALAKPWDAEEIVDTIAEALRCVDALR